MEVLHVAVFLLRALSNLKRYSFLLLANPSHHGIKWVKHTMVFSRLHVYHATADFENGSRYWYEISTVDLRDPDLAIVNEIIQNNHKPRSVLFKTRPS